MLARQSATISRDTFLDAIAAGGLEHVPVAASFGRR
jgi:hypothetical protein